jgi:hypothetical protein
LDGGGNSPGGDVAPSPPREEPVPSASLPSHSPVKRLREASALGTHWRKTKWEVCRSLTQLGNPFLITDAALRPTGDIMEIKPEGGTFKVTREVVCLPDESVESIQTALNNITTDLGSVEAYIIDLSISVPNHQCLTVGFIRECRACRVESKIIESQTVRGRLLI